MYGHQKYGLPKKSTDQPVASSVPTFVCSRCKQVKTVNSSHIEITALDKNELFLYTRLCESCAKLFKVWLKE